MSGTTQRTLTILVLVLAAFLAAAAPAGAALTDTSAADFGAGSTGTDTFVSEAVNGEVILKPTVGEEFSGAGLPLGWTSFIWNPGGSATATAGHLAIDGARAGTTALYSSGHTLEFTATIGNSPFQGAGFAFDFNDQPWAIFSTKADSLPYARTANGFSFIDTPLSPSLLGTAHRYRIDWNAASVDFFVDGVLVASHAVSFGAAQMRPMFTDFNAGGAELTADSLRMTPYSSAGTFTSRVLDAGQQVDWGALTWSADAPSGTSVALSVRTGNTSTPDGSWSGFSPISSSGGDVPGNSRYMQYSAQLATTDTNVTPALNDVTADYVAGVDAEPPTVTGRTPSPGATDVAVGTNVTAQFSEPMNAATIDGASFRLRADGAGTDVPATVSYASGTATLDPTGDLATSTLYHVTVAGTVEDANGNALGSDDTWTFTTAAPAPLQFTDTTVSDFGAGTVGTDTYVSQAEDGEVILKPTVGEEFLGATLPSGWESVPWNPGGTATVGGGKVTVDGTRVSTTGAAFGPGRSIEFVATFGSATFQHAGLSDNFDSSIAIFSTRDSTTQLFARTNSGDVPLGALLNTPHRFRIDWGASTVNFFVDGAQVATSNVTFGVSLRPALSDFSTGGPSLSVDWMHMSPYPSSGTFLSRVFDSTTSAEWGALSWTADTPSGTALALSVRTGNTPTPDGSWTSFTQISSSGGDIPGNSRYIQYRAEPTTTNTDLTPVLRNVTINYFAAPDTTAPTVVERSPSSVATDVAPSTNVTARFSEPMNAATIDGSSFRLRAQGAGSDVAASVSYSGTTATLDPNANLAANTVYDVTVDGSVEDANGNAMGSDDTWSFTTGAAVFGLIDTTVAHFGAGTTGTDTYVSEMADGEVILNPTVGEEFSGATMPLGWSSTIWNAGGSATVGAGKLTVNGARAGTDALYGSDHSLQFAATYQAVPFESGGFAFDFNDQPWATFSTRADPNLYTRTANGASFVDNPLSGSLLGSQHRYRIDWNPTDVQFLVDDAPATTHAVGFGSAQMRPLFTEFNAGGGFLTVDWVHMSPYPSAGTFFSRVFDGGSSVSWGGLSWTADVPAGTGVALSVRIGNTPTPDGTWSGFTPVSSSGADIAGSSRYLQYQAELTTSDVKVTPALNDVSISYSDTEAPDVTIDSVSESPVGATDTSTELTWDASENGDFSVRVGGSSCATGTQVSSGTYSGAPGQHVTTIQASDLAEGDNTVRVCVTDAANNTGSETVVVPKDTVAPGVAIDAVSDTLLAAGGPSTDVTWHATQNGGFSVRVGGSGCADGAVVASGSYLTSPHTRSTTVNASDLSEGANTVRVCVTDAAGNPGSDTTTVTKDTTSPTVTIDSVSDDLLGPSDSSTDVTWHADEDGDYSVRVGGTDCHNGNEIASGTYSSPGAQVTTVQASDFAEGDNTIRVCVADVAGNEGSDTTTVTKDTASPTATIDSVSDDLLGPSDSSTDVTWHADEEGTYSVRVGGTDCDDGNEVASGSYSGAPGQQVTTVQASDLAEGDNTIRVCVADAAGNEGSDTTTVTKDTTSPTVTIDSVSDDLLGPSDSSTAVDWHADEDGTYSVRVGGTDCDDGDELDSGGYTGAPVQHETTIDASDLAEGANTVRVCVTDAAGITGAATTTITKDTTAPTVTIDSVSNSLLGPTDTSTAVNWHASEDGTYTVRIGGTDCSDGEEVASGSYTGAPAQTVTTIQASELEQGSNTVRVCLTDAVGQSSSDTTTVMKVSIAPSVTIDSVSDSVLGPSDSSTDVTWHADQNGTYTVRVGGSDCGTGDEVAGGSYDDSPNQHVTTIDAADFAEGSNTVRVCVVNAVSSEGSDTATVVVDTIAPTVAIDSVSSAIVGPGGSTDVTWHADENGTYSVRVGGTDCDDGDEVAGGSYTGSPATHATTVHASDLAEGDNTIRVCVTDLGDNTGSATTSVAKDTTAPAVEIDAVSDPLVTSGDTSTDVTWHSDEDGNYSVRVGGADCDDGTEVASGSYTGSPATQVTTVQASDLAEGDNTIRVCVTDGRGNTGSATVSVTKDAATPVVSIDAVSNSDLVFGDTSTDVTWHANEDGTYSIRVGGSSCSTGTEVDSGAYSGAPAQLVTTIQASALTGGTNTIRVCVTDGNGNTGFATVGVHKNDFYPRPSDATPLRVPLIPAYAECTSPNSTHVGPLDNPACDPPELESTVLTTSAVGRGHGYVRFSVLPGIVSTSADEADIAIQVFANDVIADGSDYEGQLLLRTLLRTTDRRNGASETEPGTVSDALISVPVDCAASPSPRLGGKCELTTTADTLMPGFAAEGRRAVMSVVSVELDDAGEDGTLVPGVPSALGCPPACGSGDERPYLREGVFLP